MIKQVQRGDPTVASFGLNQIPAPSSALERTLSGRCEECGSSYFATTSQVSALCAECAHHLYGYPACEHRMVAGRCEECGWDGSVSDYLKMVTGRSKTPR